MNRERSNEFIKKQLKQYLFSKGINIQKPFSCLNPNHNDRNPSMSYDKKRNKVHCFSCGSDYDMFDLIGIDYDLTDAKDIFQKAYEVFGAEYLQLDDESARSRNAFKKKRTKTRLEFKIYSPIST